MKKDWLLKATDILYRLSDFTSTYQAWSDFVYWGAYQTSYKNDTIKTRQSSILKKYPVECKDLFAHLYRIIGYVISQAPHQNVLLKLMHAIHLSGGYFYDEQEAKDILLIRNHHLNSNDISYRWTQYDNPYFKHDDARNGASYQQFSFPGYHFEPDTSDISDFLKLGVISFIDDSSSLTNGSRLIAVANVFRDNFPLNFPDRIILIASDEHNPIYSLMSFIQMSMMGMACYALTDLDYGIITFNHMELFAPPTAVCSLPCFSDAWNALRYLAILSTRLGYIF